MSQETKGKSEFEVAQEIKALLESLPPDKREMALRWARESAGLPVHAVPKQHEQGMTSGPLGGDKSTSVASGSPDPNVQPRQKSLKDFTNEKQPKSDVQFAAAVAYFHRFEAAGENRKDSINAEDLQEGSRLAGRPRFSKPSTTLNNAVNLGYLDRGSERGTYKLNAVGENLVAMALPSDGTGRPPAVARTRPKVRTTERKVTKAPATSASKKSGKK